MTGYTGDVEQERPETARRTVRSSTAVVPTAQQQATATDRPHLSCLEQQASRGFVPTAILETYRMASTSSELDEQIQRLRKGDTLAENEVKALCDKVSSRSPGYTPSAECKASIGGRN